MGLIKKNLKIKWSNQKNNLWGWVRIMKIKGKKQVKSFQKKSRLNKIFLKYIMMLGCMKFVNFDIEFQIRMMKKIFLLVKLKL